MARVFTVDQANSMLPLVRRIAEDAIRDYVRWEDRVREFEIASLRSTVERPDEVAVALEEDVQRLAKALDGYVQELRELGVEMKGLETGIVDFPGEIDGRSVCLCWCVGEPAVGHWHEKDAGFAGRQPLGAEFN